VFRIPPVSLEGQQICVSLNNSKAALSNVKYMAIIRITSFPTDSEKSVFRLLFSVKILLNNVFVG